MSVGKRVIMVIAVISILILAMAGTTSPPPIHTGKYFEGLEPEEQELPGMDANDIFFAPKFDSIAMYGDPKDWDDEKNLCVDTNGDGQNDVNFTIAANAYKGIDLEGSVKQGDGSWKSINFWSSDLYPLFRNYLQGKAQTQTAIKAKDFLTLEIPGLLLLLQDGKYIVKGGCIVDDDYVQISVCDIDEDGLEEVIASVGNRFDENVTAIYELSDDGKAPFTYCGYIDCNTVVEYKGHKILWAYSGNLKDKLHNTYIYDDGRIKKAAPAPNRINR